METLKASLEQLQPRYRLQVERTIFRFQVNPENPTLNFKKIDNIQDKEFYSIQVPKSRTDLLVIIHRTPQVYVCCYAAETEDAIAWVEKHNIYIHTSDTNDFLVSFSSEQSDETASFSGYSESKLQELGVPSKLLEEAMSVTSSNLMNFLKKIPSDAANRLMDLAAQSDNPIYLFVESDTDLRLALQTDWKQWMVYLHKSQKEAIERDYTGPAKVTGGAGTGKTVVALHRAAHIAQHSEGKILLTTSSKTLTRRLSTQLHQILPREQATRIAVQQLHRIAHALLSKYTKKAVKLADEPAILRGYLKAACDKYDIQDFDIEFLRTEFIYVICDYKIQTLEEYKTIARNGRGRSLKPTQKEKLWPIFAHTQEALNKAKILTLSEAYQQATELVSQHKNEQFQHVIVDEAQDFSYPELLFIRALAPQAANDLFLCADPAQRTLSVKVPWSKAGIQIVKGRSNKLSINYRTSKEILNFASKLINASIEDEDGELIDQQLTSSFSGPTPEVLSYSSIQEEIEGVCVWIKERLEEGYQARDILILARTELLLAQRAEAILENQNIDYLYLRDDQSLADELASLGTMEQAKGIESKLVVIMGCEEGIIPQIPSSTTDEDELKQIHTQEKNLLYVACTRAREQLLVTHTGQKTSLLSNN